MQGIDARFKSFSVFVIVLCALFTGHISLLLALYLLCLVLSALSRIKTVFFLKRTLFFIPFFSLFIVLPAVFSSITPGDTVWTFAGASITKQGLYSAALLVCRVTVSVSFVVLLSLVTRHFELLKALGAFGVPQVFIMTAGMCYRYIYLFAETVAGTFLAIKSRAGGVVRTRHGQKIAAWNMAMLWKRSYAMNEQVYNAMLSRGYAGTAVALVRFKTKARDILWLVFSCAAAAVILIIDRMPIRR
jgi:cobalt ECF transporter T component CbiQ